MKSKNKFLENAFPWGPRKTFPRTFEKNSLNQRPKKRTDSNQGIVGGEKFGKNKKCRATCGQEGAAAKRPIKVCMSKFNFASWSDSGLVMEDS
jgi:hypothetical protein